MRRAIFVALLLAGCGTSPTLPDTDDATSDAEDTAAEVAPVVDSSENDGAIDALIDAIPSDGAIDADAGPSAKVIPWTDLGAPPADARVVYVAQGGTGDGSSPSSPLGRLEDGFARLRHGMPDRLLLRRGSVFALASTFAWTKGGRSKTERMVLGTYGSEPARPRLEISNGSDALHVTPGYRSANVVRHLAIIGIELYAPTRDPSSPRWTPSLASSGGRGILFIGVETTGPLDTDDVLVEDVRIRNFGVGIELTGRNRGFALRKSIVHEIFATGGGQGIGLLASRVEGITLEGNVFDRIQQGQAGATATQFHHGVYLQNDVTAAIVRDNVFARSPDGVMQRPGGVFEGNVVVRCGISSLQGYVYAPPATAGGVTLSVKDNAFLDLADISPSLSRGFGLIVGNVKNGLVEGNVIARRVGSGGIGIVFEGFDTNGNVGIRDMVVRANVVHGVATPIALNGSRYVNVTVEKNGFAYGGAVPAGVTMTSNAPASPKDAARGVESYMKSIGNPPTLEAFLAKATSMSRPDWDDRFAAPPVLAHVREGFF